MAEKFFKLGIIGWPLGYSLSPKMHTAALQAVGLADQYKYLEEPVESEKLEDWLGNKALEFHGFNVTMPHKEAVYEWMVRNPERASVEKVPEGLRAVNTVKLENGKLLGFNTDRQGFVGPLVKREGQDCLKGKRVLLLGAGGAAQAIAVNVVVYGATSLDIWNRNAQRAKSLAEEIKKSWGGSCKVSVRQSPEVLSDADLIVNATSSGMEASDLLLIPEASLEKRHWVYDIVYQPKETKLIQAARQRHCQVVVTGDEMLAHQGAEAFHVWFSDRLAPKFGSMWDVEIVKVMQKTLDDHFAEHRN